MEAAVVVAHVHVLILFILLIYVGRPQQQQRENVSYLNGSKTDYNEGCLGGQFPLKSVALCLSIFSWRELIVGFGDDDDYDYADDHDDDGYDYYYDKEDTARVSSRST